MSKLKFQATHRVLVKATLTGHGYHLITIDVNNGTFNKNEVAADDTKIRVGKGIFAEKLGFEGGGLSSKKAQEVIDQFNAKRVELGFDAFEFYRVENVNAKSE